MEAMSFGLMPVRLPPGPELTGVPSITYSGSLLPVIDELPRMRIAMLPSAVCEMYNPGTLAASARSMDSLGVRSRSSAVTRFGFRGRLAVGSGSALFPEAHPEMSPAKRPQTTAARSENDMLLLARGPGNRP